MIPSILSPYVCVFCEESDNLDDGSEQCNGAHLDPKGGFSALISCTEEVNFGILCMMG